MRTFWRTCRVSAAVAAVALAALLSLSFAATASALPDSHPNHCGNTCPGPGPNTGGGPGPTDTGDPAPDPEPEPEPEPDSDDLWTSECDDAGDCESVPGFMDLGSGGGSGFPGPFGSGPRR